MKRYGVCPSACLIRPLQQRAAGLLLWARWAGDIDRLQHGGAAAALGRSTARCSKCGQCHVFSVRT